MRKNAQTFVELNCGYCKRQFSLALKVYNYKNRKWGQTVFYCSDFCGHKGHRDEFSDFRPIINGCRKTAKHRFKTIDITEADLKDLWEKQRGICPYTGIALALPKWKEKTRPHTASLDRIDSAKGYVKGNVEFVCLFVNLGKNGFTKNETREFIAAVCAKITQIYAETTKASRDGQHNI